MTAAVVFFTGCQSAPAPKTSGKTLRISMNRDPSSMDPRKGGDVTSATLHFMTFEGLIKMEEDGSFSLALAEAITVSEDKTVYTFHLRNASWSDGTPITAKNFEIAWKSCLDPAFPCPNVQLFYPIKNAEAIKKGKLPIETAGILALDNKTLQITLAAPNPHFLSIISFCSFSPINLSTTSSYISNGPFLLDHWQHNRELVLVKNPHYWNKEAIALDEIRICIIDNEMTTLYMYENGELDLIATPFSPIPIDALQEYKTQGKLFSLSEPGSTLSFFNTEAFPFHNLHIRKAFAYAINREEIVNNITQLGEIPATSIIPPVLKKNSRNLFADHDKQSARALLQKGLEELGLSSPQELGKIVYKYLSTEGNRKIAQILQQQWFRALGVRVELEQLEHKFLMDALSRRTFSIAQGFWMAQYPDQMNLLERFNAKGNIKNYSGWESAEFTRLLELSNYAASPTERLEILEQAEALLIDNMPVCPLFHWKSALLAKPHLDIPACTPCGGAFYERLRTKDVSIQNLDNKPHKG